MFKVVRVSGTIKKVEEEVVRGARIMISAAQENNGRDGTLRAVFGTDDGQTIENVDMEEVETSDED